MILSNPRIITTEPELNAAPPKSVVIARDGEPWVRLKDSGDEWPSWQCRLWPSPINPAYLLRHFGPVVLVWQP